MALEEKMGMNGLGIWAVMPVKAFDRAKTRLARVLPPHQRRELCSAMMRDVLTAIHLTNIFTGTIVVTGDPHTQAIASEFDAEIIDDPSDDGPSHAVAIAARRLESEGCKTMMAIMADTPLASAGELRKLLAHHRSPPAVTLVPAHDGVGCNAAVCSPPQIINLTFDGLSLASHQQRARQRGAALETVRLPGLSLDIDNPDDLEELMKLHSNSHTAKACQLWDISSKEVFA